MTSKDHSAGGDSKPLGKSCEQLSQALAQDIRDHYIPGDRFETEVRLSRRLGLERELVRDAVALLVDRGLLERHGRSSLIVMDYTKTGSDDRLVCLALAQEDHLWDRTLMSLCTQFSAQDRVPMVCGLSEGGAQTSGMAFLKPKELARHLELFLRYRPSTLVTSCVETLERLSSQALSCFQKLIVLSEHMTAAGESLNEDLHNKPFARVIADRNAAFRMLGRAARATGYRKACLLATSGTSTTLAERQLAVKKGGGFRIFTQLVLRQSDPNWEQELIEMTEASSRPFALICDNDHGAHLAQEALLDANIDVPGKVGVFGQDDTPWSLVSDLTSVSFDPILWAEKVLEADMLLDQGESGMVIHIPPTLVQRGSTKPITGKAFDSWQRWLRS